MVNSLTRLCSEDNVEAYTRIRHMYVLPTILGYVSARHYASKYLGSQVLLPCLELATLIADEDVNPHLSDDFAQTGLLDDFIKSMALTSRLMLRLNQEREVAVQSEEKVNGNGVAKKRRSKKNEGKRGRFWNGETIDVWDPTKVV